MSGSTKKQADLFLTCFTEAIQSSLEGGEKVTLVGFGTFEARERKQRIGRNPQDGSEISIPARRVACFSAGKRLKEILENNP